MNDMHQPLIYEESNPISNKSVTDKHVVSRFNAFDSALIVQNVCVI